MNDYKELINELRSLANNDKIPYLSLHEAFSKSADAIEQIVKERNQIQNDLWEANDLLEFKDDMIKRLKAKCDTCPHNFKWERGFVDEE